MKKALAFLLIAAMALSLTACGGSEENDPNAGLYEAVSAEMGGLSIQVDSVFEDGFSLELKNGGKATFHYDGKDYSLKWSLEGDTFHAEGGGAQLDGTLSDGVMVLQNVLDSGISITLEDKNHAASAPAEEPSADAEPAGETEPTKAAEPETDADPLNWWRGRWYGWFVVYSAAGVYADNEDTAFDLVAEIETDGESGRFICWNYAADRDNGFGDVELRFDPKGASEHGKMISVSGRCLSDTVEPEEWNIDPGNSMVDELDHMISIGGKYTDPSDSDNWYVYYMFLRPWGMSWEDVRGMNTDDMPYTDMMPMEYDDWYAPQIGEGETAPTEAPAPAPTEAPEETGLYPNEPSSAGDGRTTMENVLRLCKWIDTMDSSLTRSKTYSDFVAVAGVEGFDCGNRGPNSMSELGDHYFNWYADDTHFIHVGFRGRDDGSWTYCGLNTSNITRGDFEDVDISDLAPKAGGETKEVTLPLKDFFDKVSGSVTADIPTLEWFTKASSGTAYLYNAASEDRIGSSTARIQFNIEPDLERFDTYKDRFENLKDLDSRTIGGIEMTGRSYGMYGMKWIEFLGVSDTGAAVSVKISGVEIADGSQGDAILNSVRFAFD